MASVWETFLIKFVTDASQVKQGTSEAKKSTDDLNKSLNTTDVIGTKVGGSLKNLAVQYGGLLLSALSVGGIIKGINNAANFADKLDELSKALNVNVEELSVWGDAVKLNGGTAESFQDTVKQMTASLADFATKGTSRTAPFFKALGIRMTDAAGRARSFFEILPELADAFQKLGRQESFGIGQKLGLDQGTIMLLQQGRREVDLIIGRQKELGVVTKQDAEIAAKFNDAWDDTAHAFRSLFTAVGSSVLPAFTKILNIVEKTTLWIRDHSDLVTGFLIGIAVVTSNFLIPALIKLFTVAGPFLRVAGWVAVLATAFSLAYEDVMHFLDGQDSLLRVMLEKYPVVGEIIIGIIKVFKTLWQVAKPILDGIWQSAKALFDIFTDALSAIFKVVGAISEMLGFTGKIKEFFGFSTAEEGDTRSVSDRLRDELSFADSTPLNSVTSNAISRTANSSRNTSVNTGPISIYTQATDSNSIAGAIGTSIEDRMRQAVSDFDDGLQA